MIRAVSFDIGGTLIKVSKEHSVLLKIHAISDASLDEMKSAYLEHFLKKKITLEQFCERAKIRSPEDILNIVHQYYNSKPIPTVYYDVLPVLKKLSEYGLLQITISNKSYKNPFCLKVCSLKQWFGEEFYSYDAMCTKPDINIFRYVERHIQIKPSQILHVGDSFASDYMGAKKAAWNSVLLCRDGCHVIPHYNDSKIQVINSLAFLPEIVERLI